MSSYPGIYRARCIGVTGDEIKAYVPQVFGVLPITTNNRTGALPSPNTNGWVSFEGAQASLPVWVSHSGSGSGSDAPRASGTTIYDGGAA
jgi:hypothetical protein